MTNNTNGSYTRTENVTFQYVLSHLRAGYHAWRVTDSWNNGKQIYLVPASDITVSADRPLGKACPFLVGTTVHYSEHIDYVLPGGLVGIWQPTQEDILANDWSVAKYR